ncbi:MAG: hypothetical protein QME79_12885 [Bacillota bacterium]|nr:hypothetical protein [Bacillota bacterium]
MRRFLAWAAAAAAFALSGPALAAGSGVDLLPPVVEVVSPRPAETVHDTRPVLEVALSDSGVGVNPAAVRLVLDQVDLTHLLTVSPLTEASRAPEYPAAERLRVTCQPTAPLRPGLHRVWLQAADRAGNVATATWSFQVEVKPAWEGWRAGGRTALEVSVLPLKQFQQGVEVFVKSPAAPGAEGSAPPWALEVQAEAAACSDLVGVDQPLAGWTGSLRRYSVSLERDGVALAAGALGLTLPSRLLSPQNVSEGWRAALHRPGQGEEAWQVSTFGGRALTSLGFHLTATEFRGASGEVELPGLGLRGALAEARAGAAEGGVAVLGVETPRWRGARFAAEGGTSIGGAGERGEAWLAALDFQEQRTNLSLEWAHLSAGFQTPLLASELLGRDGIRRFRARGTQVLGGSWLAAFDLVHRLEAAEAPADSRSAAADGLLELHYLPPGNYCYSARYQRSARSPAPSPDSVNQVLTGTVEYRDRRGGRWESWSLKAAQAWSGAGAPRGATAAVQVSRSFRLGEVEGACEYATDYHPAEQARSASRRVRLTVRPVLPVRLAGREQRLTGELTADFLRENRQPDFGDPLPDRIVNQLAAKLSAEFAPGAQLLFIYQHVWTEPQDRTLRLEYRQSF